MPEEPNLLVLLILPGIVIGVISVGLRLLMNLIEVWGSQDTRKKKRDEYDAHYDALLSQPEQDSNIAYYEDDAFSHLTNK